MKLEDGCLLAFLGILAGGAIGYVLVQGDLSSSEDYVPTSLVAIPLGAMIGAIVAPIVFSVAAALWNRLRDRLQREP